MPAISTAIMAASAVAGLGVSAYGMSQQQKGINQQQQAAQLQAGYSAQGAQLSAQYAGLQAGIKQQASEAYSEASTSSKGINTALIQAQQQQEDVRRTSMEIGARYSQLQTIRGMQQARALALTTATAQGGSGGRTSSALRGGYGQISGQGNENLTAIGLNLAQGEQMFDLNKIIAGKQMEMVNVQDVLAQKQASLTTQDAQLQMQYAQKQAALQTQAAAAGVTMAEGQATSAFGSSLFGAGPQLFNFGSNFAKLAPSMGFGGGMNWDSLGWSAAGTMKG